MFDKTNTAWFVRLTSRSTAFSRPLSHRKAAATVAIYAGDCYVGLFFMGRFIVVLYSHRDVTELSILRFIKPGLLYSMQEVCFKGSFLHIENSLILGDFFSRMVLRT